MDQLIDIFSFTFLTGGLFGGFVVWFLKYIITRFDKKKSELAEKQREAFIQFLELWQQRRTDYSEEWSKSLGKAANNMMIWCPDKALYHFGLYLENFSKPEAELHFGNAILAFRKSLGYKNRWWRKEKVTAKTIVDIYSASGPNAIE